MLRNIKRLYVLPAIILVTIVFLFLRGEEIMSIRNLSITASIVGICLMSLLPISNAMAEAKEKPQDLKRAVQYFEDEMNFKTNPHGANYVVEGKVKNVTIVDVRTAEDFAAGHIPGAINIPFDKFHNFEGNEKEFPGLRRDGYNYVYCYELLCNLAQKATKKFALTGYPVKELSGGYKSWKDGGYPIEK
jgi:rhodanese-related sulfurtransferase